jgi:hypothetical protein
VSVLETRLRELSAEIAFPPTPDLAGAVRERLPAAREPWWRRRRVLLAVALSGAALAAGVLAVPSARTAILDWLGIGGVEVRFVDELPARPLAEELDLGERVTLAEARRRADLDVLPPPTSLGRDPEIYLRDPPAGGMVSYLYGGRDETRLLISQFRGDYGRFITKFVDSSQASSTPTVAGVPALWLEGAHLVVYEDDRGLFIEEGTRLARNVLLLQRDGVTYRIEGALDEAEAVDVAERLLSGTAR